MWAELIPAHVTPNSVLQRGSRDGCWDMLICGRGMSPPLPRPHVSCMKENSWNSAAMGAEHVELQERLRGALQPYGFQVHPFQVGWYNDVLDPVFRLSYPPDSLAFLVLSLPAMFEKAFLPFLRDQKLEILRDPIDQCVSHHMARAKELFPSHHIDIIYDYELHPNRRPKVLMQTAAHVSGAAYYYQRKDVTDDPWGKRKMFGVCIHPQFGGWFAMRAVLVFSDVRSPALQQHQPIDCVPDRQERIHLLENFNYNWRDGRYRDATPPEERYSQEQTLYFSTPPAERMALLEKWGHLLPSVPC